MTNFEPCAAEVMRQFVAIAGGELLEVGGGVAGYTGPGSFLNGVKGLDGNVGPAELRRIIEFFGDRGEDAVVELAPWVEAACQNDLARLGFTRQAEEWVLAARCRNEPDLAEMVAPDDEWARVLSIAFFGEWSPMGAWVGKLMREIRSATCVAWREEGQLVAAAQVCWVAGAALLGGDGTLPAFRGRGLQQLLIRDRLGRAYRQGLEWAHAEVQPESGSWRNYRRCGFERVYSRVHFRKSLSAQ